MKDERYSMIGISREVHEQFKKFADENCVVMGQFAAKAIVEKMERFNGDEA